MKYRFYFFFQIILFAFTIINSYAIDTLKVEKLKNEIGIYQDIYILEDSDNRLTIDSFNSPLHDTAFQKNNNKKLNFEFSTSTYWLKLIIKNVSPVSGDFVLEISNPDLDHISFYELIEDTIRRRIETGELHDVKTRENIHRNFLFNIHLNPGETYKYYISVNNGGHPIFIPILLKERGYFEQSNSKTELIFWLLNGFLFFVIIFNIYLTQITKDKLNLYYSLYVFFLTIGIINYDGYFFYFNPPIFLEKIKWINPGLYTVFLLSFTQAFTRIDIKLGWLKKILNPFKIIAIIAVFFYAFKHPFSLVADVGIPLLILITLILIIFIAILNLDRKFSPSLLLLIAFLTIFFSLLIHEFKEFDIIPPSFFVDNAVKFGQVIQCSLLTIAVLERFRINQENAKKKIQESLSQIEVQNKELEIINTELEKLSVVASETDNGVAICDQKGRLEWCNSGFEKMYDVFLDDLIKEQKDCIENVIPNPYITRLLRECTITKKPVSFETLVVTKKKREIWVQTTLTPFVRHEEIQKIIVIDSDISDLKLAEKKLHAAMEKAVESDRLKTVFLGNMSHEIRTPLNGILGFSELLFEKNIPDDKKTKYLKIIRSNGDQLMRIIDDIVDISLIESNQLRVFYSVFDLKSFFYEVVEFFESHRNTVNKPGIKLTSEFKTDQESIAVYSDKLRLKQVSMNLIKNAFKFTETGEIKFGCFISQNLITFYVEDTGIGIDPSKKDIVFERFRQGDETLSRRFGGNGLGLSISKGIIENLNGSIWIDHTYKDGFRIFFSVPYLTSENENEEAKNFLKKDSAKDTIVS